MASEGVNAGTRTGKSASAERRTQQARHANGIDDRHHHVEDAGNEEGTKAYRLVQQQNLPAVIDRPGIELA